MAVLINTCQVRTLGLELLHILPASTIGPGGATHQSRDCTVYSHCQHRPSIWGGQRTHRLSAIYISSITRTEINRRA